MILAMRRYRSFHSAHAIFSQCIRFGALINKRNSSGYTALYYAVESHSMYAVKALLRLHATPNMLVNNACSLLHYSICTRNAKITRELFYYTSDKYLKMRDRFTGNTILHDMKTTQYPFINEALEDTIVLDMVGIRNNSGHTPFGAKLV